MTLKKLAEGLTWVRRWVCDSCGANWYNAPAGKCPACSGPGRERDVVQMGSGVVRLPTLEEAPRD